MDIEKIFTVIGGRFLKPASAIRSNLRDVKAFIFDWDGVFNNGSKSGSSGSPFSEIDSMGINLLRFSRWMEDKKVAPAFIITGENNPPALELSQREHFNAVFLSFKDKTQALTIISEKYSLNPENLAMVFDDILDLSLASKCRLSFCVGRKASPLLEKYIIENGMAAYITGSRGGNHAVREVCELVMGLEGTYDTALQHRIQFSDDYRQYLEDRKLIEADVFSGKERV
jgi:3-deoxy-D-manno-octulosonate 8-phosphate phosphatase (KDO 8-P phosphatase)